MSDQNRFNDESGEVNDALIELTDETTGEKVIFEHLDTVEFEDGIYFMLTEYDKENPEPDESDVYVMQLVTGDDGEETLEMVEDDDIITAVFDEFKERVGDDFEFLD